MRRFLFLVFALLLAMPSLAMANALKSGLPIPRFASLRADQVNVRVGPSSQYPIEWVFVKRHLPVEIVAEYEAWRKIRDTQGTEGWVHRALLSGNRTVLIQGKMQNLYGDPDGQSTVVAKAEANVIARLLECEGAWCRIDIDNHRGWILRENLWGVYAHEDIE